MVEHPYDSEGYKDPRTATAQQIKLRTEELLGKSFNDIVSLSPFNKGTKEPSSIEQHGKGAPGQLIEYFGFGIEKNNEEEPDFIKAGIELKVVPLKKLKRSPDLSVKERTKICSINYPKLYKETWQDSHARKKLRKVLFLYYYYDRSEMMDSEVKKYEFWDLDLSKEEPIIQNDWWAVHHKVSEGRAHELSGTMGRLLEASTSGYGKDVPQPVQTIRPVARERSFSLKPCFTRQRWHELLAPHKYESIIANLGLKNAATFEVEVLKRLEALRGVSIVSAAEQFGIKIQNGKSAVAAILKKLLGFKNVNSRIKEFEQFGIEVKVVPVRTKDLRPWEAVSFPAFRLKELEVEKWEESDLAEYLERILFIPILYDEHETPQNKKNIGKAFFWSPSDDEWKTIAEEWRMYQQEILDGKCQITYKKTKNGVKEITGLTKESKTQIIHIRPHGKIRDDRDEDSKGNKPTKQSFWLNKGFVQKLLVKNEIKP